MFSGKLFYDMEGLGVSVLQCSLTTSFPVLSSEEAPVTGEVKQIMKIK